jgi:hypothetical protein
MLDLTGEFKMVHHVSLNFINGIKVSTILLDGQYETCVFEGDDSNVVGYYDTEEDAIAGHNRIMAEFCLNGLHLVNS